MKLDRQVWLLRNGDGKRVSHAIKSLALRNGQLVALLWCHERVRISAMVDLEYVPQTVECKQCKKLLSSANPATITSAVR